LKFNPTLYSSLLLVTALAAQASPVLIVGTPGNSQLATPTGPSPILGNLINFDSLTPFSTFVPSTYTADGITSISSPDGLEVLPYSTQSFPNELFDESADGTANITIDLATGIRAIGIGIADSDPVDITLQALGAGGVDLGSPFVIDLATTESTVNTGNGYYAVEDSSKDIYGLRITQSTGNANYSGLAIDDLQTTATPEPSSALLLTAGLAIFGYFRLRRRA
jgi:PEP-CTERM motif